MIKEKIGFLGGTFDPLHLGHLNLAIQIQEQKGLTKILFCPAYCSPNKVDTPPEALVKDRLNMLHLGIEAIPTFELYDKELSRPSPSYTIDTIREYLQEVKEEKELYLILAQNTLDALGKWKEVDQLLELASPLIGTRFGLKEEKMAPFSPSTRMKIEEGVCQMCAMDISSTDIRERLKNNLYCGHLLPAKVLDYIYSNGLYSSS